jgi:hypothetical protein
LLLGVALPSDSAQVPLSGADAVRAIDWSSVYIGSAIPESMPTADAYDAVDAGFAREWLERALLAGRPSLSGLALDIVSKRRTVDDRWADGMTSELRGLVHSKLQKASAARVFCNAVGCLFYFEIDPLPDPLFGRELLEEMKRKFGLNLVDFDSAWGASAWELTVIRRPVTSNPRLERP